MKKKIIEYYNTVPSDVLVSICVITYNHANYIRTCLDSIVMQKTRFKYEILVGEDESDDGTREICLSYAEKYPNKIRLLLHSRENVIYIGGQPTGRFNAIYTKAKVRGKYIAFCEGDDYWIDLCKLQKQVDFLEANLAYSGCVHQTLVKSKNTERLFHTKVKSDIGMNDLLGDRLFHTASLVYRAEILKNIELPTTIVSLDRLLFFWVAFYGPIHFFEDVMCVYRKNEGGISSRVSYDAMKADLNMIPWLEENIPGFPKYKYLSFIHKTLFVYPKQKMPLKTFLKHYFLYVFFSFSFFPKNLVDVAYMTFRYIPRRFLMDKLR